MSNNCKKPAKKDFNKISCQYIPLENISHSFKFVYDLNKNIWKKVMAANLTRYERISAFDILSVSFRRKTTMLKLLESLT